MTIQNLVFSGGGAAGCAFGGAIMGLAEQPNFSFADIKVVAGSSVGAIAALIVSLNYTPVQASAKIEQLNLQKLRDGGPKLSQAYRLMNHYGRFKGNALFHFILDILAEKTNRDDPENITFADLKKMGFKDLHVVTTKLYKENGNPIGKEKIFSYAKTPDTSVASAILASTAAPIYFARVRFKKLAKGKYILDKKGDLYNDGGILNNYPINLFDKPPFTDAPGTPNAQTLGLALLYADEIHKEEKPVKTIIYDKSPIDYAKGIINGLLRKQQIESVTRKENLERTIQIDRLNVRLDNFDIGDEIKQQLIISGRKAVSDYFKTYHLETKKLNNIVALPPKFSLFRYFKPANDPVFGYEEKTEKEIKEEKLSASQMGLD
ncbi:MAG: patatin-like phospholipase family protein [Gammaproteobacteria bacterium]|nr:patatin-like phospholipase family protein [Gammaproteobacteria bacterium]